MGVLEKKTHVLVYSGCSSFFKFYYIPVLAGLFVLSLLAALSVLCLITVLSVFLFSLSWSVCLVRLVVLPVVKSCRDMIFVLLISS
jgi:hypothetical protein